MARISVSQLKHACTDPRWFQQWLADPFTPPPAPFTPAGAVPVNGRLFHRIAASFTSWLSDAAHSGESGILLTRDQLWDRLWEQQARAALKTLTKSQPPEAALHLAEALKAWCRRLAGLRAAQPAFQNWRSLILTYEFDFRNIPLPARDGTNPGPVSIRVSGRPDCVQADPGQGVVVVDYKLSRGGNSRADLLQLAIYARLLQTAKPGLPFAGLLEYYEPGLRLDQRSAAELDAVFVECVQPVLNQIAACRVELPASPSQQIADFFGPVAAATLPTAPGAEAEMETKPTPAVKLQPEPESAPTPKSDIKLEPEPEPVRTPAADTAEAWRPRPEPDLSRAIVAAYESFKVPVEVLARLEAPQLIRYHLKPGPGVEFQKLRKHAVNLKIQLGLQLEPLIESGPGFVILDIVKEKPDTILWRDAILRPEIASRPSPLALPIGVNIRNELIIADLCDSNTAHALIGGSSGSGKSELLKALVATLVRRNTPESLQLSLVDPKQLTFGGIPENPFLTGPVLRGMEDSISCLQEAVADMERRFDILRPGGFTRLSERREAGLTDLPFRVLIFDEFADLINSGKEERKEFERLTQMLSNKGRAAGVHLIIATQRPDREIVTGQLKANLPLKICLRVTNAVNSQILLDEPGAELLLGRGDFLCQSGSLPERGQALLVPQSEFTALFQ